MFTITNICKNASFSSYLVLHARLKSKTHWAKLKKKTSSKYKAMNHFDDFYGSVFGNKWEPMKEALLRRNKYVAVVNNYGETEETIELLTNRGAHCLNKLTAIQQEFNNKNPSKETETNTQPTIKVNKLQEYTEKLQTDEISNVYNEREAPERLDLADISLKYSKEKEPSEFCDAKIDSKKSTLEESSDKSYIDESRIIDPSMGSPTEALYQYIPATKLKGMDEWVPESLHYSFYSKGDDFPLVIEPETEFKIPEHLKVYTYEMDSEWHTFPEPKRCTTGVYNYYPMDCGSVLAVLALCLSPGDRLLDLCSAPGGKALVALQTLLPDVVVCNDTSISRSNRQYKIFREYLCDFNTSNKWRERVMFTNIDARMFQDDQGFDKVLVDVPCTTDRHSVLEDENNIFRPDRIKERLRLPEMQAQILTNALRLVRVGGAVVYSTCSLSPIQNDGVVHMALKNAFQDHSIVAVVRDLTTSLTGCSSTLELGAGDIAPQYGQLVIPSVAANFGPSYISRLVRVK